MVSTSEHCGADVDGCPVPVIGFAAYSGAGKTTLLRGLIPRLRKQGLRVGVVKHAHHKFEIDTPGKDSYELRRAGANQMLVASAHLMVLLEETPLRGTEPLLPEFLERLDLSRLDLVLVEGLKNAKCPKIEVHRPSLGRPLLCLDDPCIIAIATDAPLSVAHIPQLKLDDVDVIAEFVVGLVSAARSEDRLSDNPFAPQ